MYSKRDYIIAALQAGATGYLIKDTTPDMLLEALDSVAAGRYFFDYNTLREIVQFILDQNCQRTSITETSDDRLTRREQEIMRLVAQGLSTKEIAAKLFISPKTVENHRTKIMEKLDVDNVVDIVKYAAKLGIIDIKTWNRSSVGMHPTTKRQTMKAFVMMGIGDAGFVQKPIPAPGLNDAVVKTTAALVCTSDCHLVAGTVGE